ncbi:hypothetical protein CAEBREN_10173 [Caenorhabditis brenneri]|uniref:CCHC-type domain-containing protein n=1 Tax=Caenorhabditis brenneri TaxID=135651 RepID=G0NW90_CAEBE|nr:hypothetical protein CAEBREN_10173 [Caenorhabditis brenneri]
MKNTAKFLRSQISRSFTTASKKLDAAKVYLNDPDVNRTDRDLRIIDMLQKEIMMILTIIETDAHFFDVIKTRDVILSDKERTALKEVVTDHFAKKPRDETIQDLKTAQDALRQILISQEYRFESQISEAELAELSHNLESFLVGDDDDNENNGDHIADNGEQEVPRLSPVTENTPILTNGTPPTFQNTAVITLSPLNENGEFVYNSDQPVAPPLIHQVRLPPREPNGPQSVHDTNVQHANRPSPPLVEKIVRSCPCCEENHELFRCKHEDLQKYCALNERCIYCTSNKHKSIDCDLVSHKSSHAPSIVSHRSRRSEIESCVTPPQKASTPYGCGIGKTDQSTRVSMRKMALRERASQENRPFHSAFTPLFEKSEYRNAKDAYHRDESDNTGTTKKSDSSIKLSFKEVLAIVSPFEGDPLDFPRFKDEFTSMVMLNDQLNDTMKLAVLKKKLVGEAKEYLVALYNPSQAVAESLDAMHRAFSEDNTAMNSALQSFRELTFNSVDFKKTAKELNYCKSILLQMKELGMDTESNTFVRTFVTKIPDKIMRELRVLFVDGREPSTQEVLAHFTEAVNDLTFAEKFKSGNVSSQGRTKELPNSIMTLDAPPGQNPRQKKQQPTDNAKKESNGKKSAQTENSKKQSNAPKASTPKQENQNAASGKTQKNTQSKPNNNATQKSESDQHQVNVSDASAVYRPVNAAYTGYHPPHPQYNNPSYFPVYPNNGSSAPQNWSYGQNSNEGQGSGNNQSTRKGNPGSSTRQNSKNTKVAKGPAPLPLGLMIGEQIEPCYNSGIGWDKNFIAHTFCRSDQTPNRCCFICGPGHSILQCPLPSYQVRQYLRSSNSCHNCTRQGHATDDCQSKATCAYCQGNHNTGGCVFKEYYRDINNYPADAPKPVLGTFFRGPQGANE